jgi:hypothetical protein
MHDYSINGSARLCLLLVVRISVYHSCSVRWCTDCLCDDAYLRQTYTNYVLATSCNRYSIATGNWGERKTAVKTGVSQVNSSNIIHYMLLT